MWRHVSFGYYFCQLERVTFPRLNFSWQLCTCRELAIVLAASGHIYHHAVVRIRIIWTRIWILCMRIRIIWMRIRIIWMRIRIIWMRICIQMEGNQNLQFSLSTCNLWMTGPKSKVLPHFCLSHLHIFALNLHVSLLQGHDIICTLGPSRQSTLTSSLLCTLPYASVGHCYWLFAVVRPVVVASVEGRTALIPSWSVTSASSASISRYLMHKIVVF